ncbi:MAG: ABC transporter substrate-binding protein [Sphingosinicella sp.]
MRRFATLAAALLIAGCGGGDSGPVRLAAIGSPPRLLNPNLERLDAVSAFFLESAAQGLVRFDAAGEIEPALAQSWIVSDDGRRYTFRIRRLNWPDGNRVTAEQVAGRLRAALSRASRNRLKPVLGAIENIVAMTDLVLEISLNGARPNLLQLLAQPDMAVLVEGRGTGPFRVLDEGRRRVRLGPIPAEDLDEDEAPPDEPQYLLSGEPAATAIALFATSEAALVLGGTAGELPLARAARLSDRLVFDPVAGLFGLAFGSNEGPLASSEVRAALSMAIDRDAIAATITGPLQPRLSLAPALAAELPRPLVPEWAALPLPMRREQAARRIAALPEPLHRLRVAMPAAPGYRLLFAHLRRDWRLIGVEAVRVGHGQPAELQLVDEVAPALLASWYFRHFRCDAGAVCDTEADAAMEQARFAASPSERRDHFAEVDRRLAALQPFIPLGSPVRWSLVSRRLNGFRPNPFARHPVETLLVTERR